MTLALANYIKCTFLFVFFMYICCCFGCSKNIEHQKEEKYASKGDESVANIWSINVTIMDGLEMSMWLK